MFSQVFAPLDLLLIVIAVPSFFFYLSFLYVAIKRRKDHPFDSTFFALGRLLGVGDCVSLIAIYVLTKPARWGVLPQLYLRFSFCLRLNCL